MMHVWPLAIPPPAATAIGVPVLSLGAAMYVAGRVQFRSFRLTWGLETGRLVTNGIYRMTRNPQTVGAILFLVGAGVIGKSGVALVLAAIAALGSVMWLWKEEAILEQRFGGPYRQYRNDVSRFLGWSASSKARRCGGPARGPVHAVQGERSDPKV